MAITIITATVMAMTTTDESDAPTAGYLTDPDAIYARSFEIVRRETKLDRFPPDVGEVVVRLVHACGMPRIAEDVAWNGDPVAAGIAALRAGAPILVDSQMVAAGITRRFLPRDVEIVTTIGKPETAALARELGTTRSAASVELWRPHVGGAVVAIGNAPTALFRLIELIEGGMPPPAAVFAFPVGFVGAAESKAALAERAHNLPFVTLHGRFGGSALAAAAINAVGLRAGAA